jgi:probable Rubsico expression protein CbbX
MRRTGLSVLLFVAAAVLITAWLVLSRPLFALAAGLLVSLAAIGVIAWDGWNQTSPSSLAARGIFPGSIGDPPVMDGGLRREWAPMIPPAIGRRMSGIRAPHRAVPPAARIPPPAAPARVPSRAVSAVSAASATPARNGQSRRRGDALAPDATISLADERRAAGIDDLFAALDSELIGLAPVKKRIAEIGSLLLVDRARQRFGLSADRPNLHMCFTGAPGTGKTTVALMMAGLLHRLGYLESDRLVHAMRDDLVGEYIGHTAPKTKQILGRAMGGVLFIDEAYTLYRAEDSKDYGQECIDILMQVMENERSRLVVILAGYKDRMDHFFESNPGMRSRVAHHLDFAAYEVDELVAIGGLMLDRSSYYLSAEAVAAFREYLSVEMSQSRFGNARSVRNALDAARLRHAHRLAAEPDRHWTRDDLMRFEPSDILPGPDSLEQR